MKYITNILIITSLLFKSLLPNNLVPEIHEHILKNGLRIIISQSENTPNVSIQMYYHVGSKDEKDDEKGLAHLLEHMVFKGTKKLSEVDIQLVADKLSGWCNASTSPDRTCYEFNLPKRHWKKVLPILADCMSNCTFKDDHLNSEFKAVIQELKMNRDDYLKTLLLEVLSISFPDHPYHFPTIGYKHNIQNLKSKDLHKFYKKHYIPNNATLVIVGDIDPKKAFESIEKHFSEIPANFSYQKDLHFSDKDIISRDVTLYRDIKNTQVYLSFIIPGLKAKQSHLISCIKNALTGDNFSRLSKALMEDRNLVYQVSTHDIQLYDYGLFWINFEPKNTKKIDLILNIITNELQKLKFEGLTEQEIKKIKNQLKSYQYNLIENNRYKASLIGEHYLANKDYYYPFTFLNIEKDKLNNEIQNFIKSYLRPCIMSTCKILQIPEEEKINWNNIQNEEDEKDSKILQERTRESEVEQPNYANKIKLKNIQDIKIKTPQEFTLKNGLKVLFVNDTKIPKVDLSIKLKATEIYEPVNMSGIYKLICDTIYKGTKNYSYSEIEHLLSTKAIDLSISPGNLYLSCLSNKFESAVSILTEILTNPIFDIKEIAKEKKRLKNNIKKFWDSPQAISKYLLSNAIYKNTVLEKNMPTEDQIDKYTQEDIVNYYKEFITPDQAYITICGNIDYENLKRILDNTLGNWTGKKINKIDIGEFTETKNEEIHHKIDRDQTLLTVCTKSTTFGDSEHYKLVLASFILSSGMSSKLFLIREQTGLYYTSQGSFVTDATEYPGIALISAIVSKINVTKVKELFLNLIKNFSQIITEEDLTKSKNQLLEIYTQKYSTRSNTLNTISQLYYFGLNWDHYKTLINKIQSVTLDEVKESLIKLLHDKEFITVTVGR